MMKKFLSLALLMAMLVACHDNGAGEMTKSGLNPQNFVSEVDGKPTALYT